MFKLEFKSRIYLNYNEPCSCCDTKYHGSLFDVSLVEYERSVLTNTEYKICDFMVGKYYRSLEVAKECSFITKDIVYLFLSKYKDKVNDNSSLIVFHLSDETRHIDLSSNKNIGLLEQLSKKEVMDCISPCKVDCIAIVDEPKPYTQYTDIRKLSNYDILYNSDDINIIFAKVE